MARPGGQTGRTVARELLARRDQRRRTCGSRSRHPRRRIRASAAIARRVVGRRAAGAYRPRQRQTRHRADCGTHRAAHHAHRTAAHRDRDAHRAVPHVEGDRHARLCQRRTRWRCAGRRRPARERRPVRASRRRGGVGSCCAAPRSRRIRGGDRPTVGFMGGRRRDPRRRDRSLHRPGSVALHRLRGRVLLRARASITPRPPQGQPLIATTVSAGDQASLELLGGSADIGFFTSPDDRATLDTVLAASDSNRREDLRLYDDLIVYLDDPQASAAGRRAQYDDWLGTHFDDGTQEFVGTAAGLADLIEERAGAAQGVRLHPAAIGHDLRLIADDLAPELRRRGLLLAPEAKPPGAHTLRETLGLRHPINRYSRTTVSGGVR